MKRVALGLLTLLLLCGKVGAFTYDDDYEVPPMSDVETANLLGYWQFNDGSATNAYNFLGKNDGILINSPIRISSGIYGAALFFTGTSSQYVNITSAPLVGNLSAFSINVWVNTTNSGSSIVVYGEGNTGSLNPRTFIDLNDGTAGNIGFGMLDDAGTDAFFATAGVSVNDGAWHMITCVQYDKSTRDIFMDGVFRTSKRNVTLGTITANTATVGVLQNNTFNNYFTGAIDQPRFFSVAITTAQIKNIYNAQK